MSGRELLLTVSPGEIRGALVSDGRLTDVFVERPAQAGIVGNVYLARVKRVLSGIGAAFVDFGHAAAFLPRDHAVAAPTMRQGSQSGSRTADPDTGISQLVAEGDAVIVQIIRDRVGGKDPQATTRVTLPGHRLVYTPTQSGAAVARRVGDDGERARLAALAEACAGTNDGFIVRTAAVGAELPALEAEARTLRERWASIVERARTASPPVLLHADADPVARILREAAHAADGAIVVDSDGLQKAVREYAASYGLAWTERLGRHEGPHDLFESREIDAAIDAALSPRVPLASGGSLVIESLEAMTVIDVNTGAHTGRGNRDATVLDTNLDAAGEIGHQLRLRNIGGLIAVDFIRTGNADHRRRILAALHAATRSDPMAVRVGDFTRFGLVELTRKRTRTPLADVLGARSAAADLPVKSDLTLAYEALRAAVGAARRQPGGRLEIAASDAIIEAFDDDTQAATAVAQAEQQLGGSLTVRREAAWPRDRYEIVVA